MSSPLPPDRFSRPALHGVIAVLAAIMLAVGLTGCGPGGEGAGSPGAGSGGSIEWIGSEGALEVELRVRPAEIRVGDRVELVLTATGPKVAEIELPDVGETLGEFAVRSVERSSGTAVEGGRVKRTLVAELDTFAAGVVEIPQLEVRAALPNNRSEPWTVTTEAVGLEVASMLADDADPRRFREIRPAAPFELMERNGVLWRMLAWAAAVVVAAVAMIVWWALGSGRGRVAPAAPPHVWAMRAMNDLAERDLPGRGEHQAYAVELSDIVRAYIERRFGLMAPERTTEEFLRELGGSELLSTAHRTLLERFLRSADMVKFARHEPTMEDCASMMTAARGFVEDTIPSAMSEQGTAGARESGGRSVAASAGRGEGSG